jgi:hypothetical protein
VSWIIVHHQVGGKESLLVVTNWRRTQAVFAVPRMGGGTGLLKHCNRPNRNANDPSRECHYHHATRTMATSSISWVFIGGGHPSSNASVPQSHHSDHHKASTAVIRNHFRATTRAGSEGIWRFDVGYSTCINRLWFRYCTIENIKNERRRFQDSSFES